MIKTIMLLLIFSYSEGELDHTYSVVIHGFKTVEQCEMHLGTLKRSIHHPLIIERSECR